MSDPTMEGVLAEERAVYQQNKKELLAQAEGRFVLIKGTHIVGTFETEMDAVRAGWAEFGNVPFLVEEIREVERTSRFLSPF